MTGGAVVTPMIMPNLPYKMSDLKPIGKMMSAVYLVLADRTLPVKTLPELIAYSKKNPGKMAYASPGIGTVNHLAMELFNLQNQLGMQHIPFTSELQVMNALMGSHIQAGAVTVPFSLKFLQANQVKALAVLGEKRDPLLPDVSTSAEQGFPDMVASIYNVLFAPAKTPMEQVNRINAAMAQAVRSEHGAAGLARMGIEPEIVPADRFAAMVKADWERYRSIVQTTGFKATLQDQFK